MQRREFIVLLGGASSFVRPVAAHSQPRVPRLGYLWQGAAGTDGSTRLGFERGLRDVGYTEGENILVGYHYADGNEERLAELIREVVASRVDLILSPGTVLTGLLKKATATIPIVSITPDPVGSGFVASLARPGGNITGLSIAAGPEVAAKWVELLREIVPGSSRIAFLWNPANSAGGADVIAKEAPDALIVDTDVLTVARRVSIAAFAMKQRLPSVFGVRDFVDEGGLVAYGASIFDIWRRAGTYVDRILKGTKPSDLPIEQPTKFELVINLNTAKALGLTVPPTLLARADEVIE
jgi:putative tryptophan/tyrosine transport system substrate-binding protein